MIIVELFVKHVIVHTSLFHVGKNVFKFKYFKSEYNVEFMWKWRLISFSLVVFMQLLCEN